MPLIYIQFLQRDDKSHHEMEILYYNLLLFCVWKRKMKFFDVNPETYFRFLYSQQDKETVRPFSGLLTSSMNEFLMLTNVTFIVSVRRFPDNFFAHVRTL